MELDEVDSVGRFGRSMEERYEEVLVVGGSWAVPGDKEKPHSAEPARSLSSSPRRST